MSMERDSAVTSVALSEALDVREYTGKGQVVLNAEGASAGTDPELDVKIQHSATADGAYVDLEDGAFATVTDTENTGLQVLPINFDNTLGFVKILPVIGGTNSPAFTFGVYIMGRKQNIGTAAAVTL